MLGRLFAVRGAEATAVRFTDEGAVVTIQRRAGVPPLLVRASSRRSVWPVGAAVTSSRSGSDEVTAGSRDCPGLVPRLRQGADRAGAVGATECPLHEFVRGRGCVAGATDGQDQPRRADAVLVDGGHRIVTGVVTDYLNADRLHGLRRIDVDDISYRRGHQYLTAITDHDMGRVVSVGVGRTAATLGEFHQRLGPQRCAQLVAVTIGGGPAFAQAIRKGSPQPENWYDGFHVIKWATETLDAVFRASELPALKARMRAAKNNKPWRKARNALRGCAAEPHPRSQGDPERDPL